MSGCNFLRRWIQKEIISSAATDLDQTQRRDLPNGPSAQRLKCCHQFLTALR
jgi:hypothetical protein